MTLTVEFWKILKGPKMGQKSLNLDRGFWARDSTGFEILQPTHFMS